jgi:chromosome segregation ATPase
MCDCVLTAPKTLPPEEYRAFFESGYKFLSERYREENVVGAYVHMDETQPHMHFAWVPVTEDGRLSAKSVVNQNELKQLHTRLKRHLEGDLGHRVDVLLDNAQKGEKQLSHLSQDEYIAAKQRLESLRREENKLTTEVRELKQAIAQKELEPPYESVAESARKLVERRRDNRKTRRLEITNQRLKYRLYRLEAEKTELEQGVSRLEHAIRAVKSQVMSIRGRVEELTVLIKRLKQRVYVREEKPVYERTKDLEEREDSRMSLEEKFRLTSSIHEALSENASIRSYPTRDRGYER